MYCTGPDFLQEMSCVLVLKMYMKILRYVPTTSPKYKVTTIFVQ